MLFDFDNEKKLHEIKENYTNIIKLRDSLADNRRKYRQFTNQIDLDFHVLDDCIKSYENALLISCYTFSEQLTKGVVYQILEKDGNSNPYVNNFINNKINPEKFSPNVKSGELSKLLSEIINDFKFILHNHGDFEKYDEMVRCRHLYAHADNYNFQFEQYKPVLNILDYLNFEFTILTTNNNLRIELRELFSKIKFLSKCLIKCATKTYRNPKISELYDVCRELKEVIQENSINVTLFNEIFEKVDLLLELDIVEENCERIYELAADVFEYF